MPNQEQIDGWKAKYKDIFAADVGGEDYIFRSLTLGEYITAKEIATTSQIDAEEQIVKFALLYPDHVSDDLAGLDTSLANQILEMSGFNSPGDMKFVLSQKRIQSESDLVIMMKAFILSAIPSYREDELDDMTFDRLSNAIVLSEHVIKMQQAAVGMQDNDLKLEIIDPVEEAERQKAEVAKHASSKKPGTAGANDPIAQKLHQAMRGH